MKGKKIQVSNRNVIYLFFPSLVILCFLIFAVIPMAAELKIIVFAMHLLLLLFSIPCVLMYINRKIDIGDDSIIYTSILGRKETYTWKDVKCFYRTSFGQYSNAKIVICFKNRKRKISFPYLCKGYDELESFLLSEDMFQKQ